MASTSEKIILAAAKSLPTTERALQELKRSVLALDTTNLESFPSKTELLASYHTLVKAKRIKQSPALEKLLVRRAVRSLSGVAIVTSLVKPYPCPGECVYCPLDERMPKSYLSEEPAAMRALTLEFSPYNQMYKRIEALENNGHPADKIEFILKGGTWNSYPLQYQYWFILESFRAANEMPLKHKNTRTVKQSRANKDILKRKNLTENSPLADLKSELFRQQRINEHAKHRIIGLTLETRPDFINYHTLWQMREQGCTRLEIGVQSTDDTINKISKRGHDTEESRRAAELARNYGFKVDFHLMPQLPGATPQSDLAMLERVFTDPGLKPDMIKIYPCTVVKGSELYDWFAAGKYNAYSTRELIDILKIFKSHIPRYCRVSRLIRDIPGQYIENGNTVTNLRQVIESEMKKDGLVCKCLRCREVGHVDIKTLEQKNIKALAPRLFVDRYDTRGGTEYFLSFEDTKRRVVYAFCRLRVLTNAIVHPNKKLNTYPAFIRELHTYGQLVAIKKNALNSSVEVRPLGGKLFSGPTPSVGRKKYSPSVLEVESPLPTVELVQHTGLGKKLMREAEKIAKKQKAKKIAVISGVGVRGYYRSQGYRLEKTYMVKKLK